jgi:hypothetical protein
MNGKKNPPSEEEGLRASARRRVIPWLQFLEMQQEFLR